MFYLRVKGQIASNSLSPSLGERIHRASFNQLANIYVVGIVLDIGGEAVSKTETLLMEESENKETDALSGDNKC